MILMLREYSLTPHYVPRVEKPFRRVVTDLPVPESLPILERLHACEPLAMRGQPPIIWQPRCARVSKRAKGMALAIVIIKQ